MNRNLSNWTSTVANGNAIVEECMVQFLLNSAENCIFLLKCFLNFNLGVRFL